MLRLTRVFGIVILAWGLAPGLGELGENTWHRLVSGHAAHAAPAAGESHAPSGPEHGCTGAFHLCGCHGSAQFTGSASASLTAAPPAHRTAGQARVALSDGNGRRVEHPPRT